jgi:hypothetical protein
MEIKLLITILLLLGMTILLILLAVGIVLSYTLQVKHQSALSLAVFIMAALIFGYCANKAVDKFKDLWL